jgi:hypothetical protein
MMGDPQQRSAQPSGLGPSEYMFEPLLRHLPQTNTLPPFGVAFRSQCDVAPSTIHCAFTKTTNPWIASRVDRSPQGSSVAS